MHTTVHMFIDYTQYEFIRNPVKFGICTLLCLVFSKISTGIPVPVIASGGVGNLTHLVDGIKIGGAEAVLAASIFHFSEYTIKEAKEAMKAEGIKVRY